MHFLRRALRSRRVLLYLLSSLSLIPVISLCILIFPPSQYISLLGDCEALLFLNFLHRISIPAKVRFHSPESTFGTFVLITSYSTNICLSTKKSNVVSEYMFAFPEGLCYNFIKLFY